MAKAFVVDSDYIKTNYPGYVEANIDNNSIESFILIAQDIQLQSVIGYNMYNYIINKLVLNPNGSTLSNKYYDILVNQIQPSVALWAIYHMSPTLTYKFTNKSLVTKHSDESNAVGIRELEYIRNQVRSSAEFYDARIVEFIKNNTTDFPEYWTTSGVDRIVPKSDVYFGGLYLEPRGRYCFRNSINLY